MGSASLGPTYTMLSCTSLRHLKLHVVLFEVAACSRASCQPLPACRSHCASVVHEMSIVHEDGHSRPVSLRAATAACQGCTSWCTAAALGPSPGLMAGVEAQAAFELNAALFCDGSRFVLEFPAVRQCVLGCQLVRKQGADARCNQIIDGMQAVKWLQRRILCGMAH